MTRKDYELIAAAIDQARADIIRNTRHDYAERANVLNGTARAASATATSLAAGNARFDRQRFLTAALEGPAYTAAQNAEALARDVGPGTGKREPTRLKFGFEQP